MRRGKGEEVEDRGVWCGRMGIQRCPCPYWEVRTPGCRRTWVVVVICRSVGVVVVMWGAGCGILRCGFAGAVAAALSLPISMW